MKEVLSYPLTPSPLSLCHVDGLQQTIPKVKLLYELESRIPNVMPPNVDATIIDAMFFLHLQKAIPGTFGALSSYLITRNVLKKEINCLWCLTKYNRHQLKIVKELKHQKTSVGS